MEKCVKTVVLYLLLMFIKSKRFDAQYSLNLFYSKEYDKKLTRQLVMMLRKPE